MKKLQDFFWPSELNPDSLTCHFTDDRSTLVFLRSPVPHKMVVGFLVGSDQKKNMGHESGWILSAENKSSHWIRLNLLGPPTLIKNAITGPWFFITNISFSKHFREKPFFLLKRFFIKRRNCIHIVCKFLLYLWLVVEFSIFYCRLKNQNCV